MNPGTSCRVQSSGYLRLSPTGCLYVFQLPAVAFGAGDPVPATAAVPPARGVPVVASTDCADTDAARATITDREARTYLPICRPVNVECDFIEVSPRCASVLFQRECVQRRPALDAHILFSINHITHGASGNGRPEIGLPKELAIAGIEGDELAVAAAGEQHIRSRSKHAAFDGRSGHPEGPLTLAGFRIHGDDGTEYLIGCLC